MMAEFQYCKLPTAILSLLATLCNISMVWYIWYNKSLKGPMKTFVTNLASVDALLSLTICIRSFYGFYPSRRQQISEKSEAVIMSYGCFLTLVQLGSQLSMSLERLCVVRYPLKYRTIYSKSSRKPFVIAIWASSVAIGTGIGVSSTIFNLPKMLPSTTWLFFSLTLLIQVITYVSIIKEIKNGHRLVDNAVSANTGMANSMRIMEQRSLKQERKLHALAVGITASFVLGITPFMVYVGIYNVKMETLGCDQLENILYTGSLFFICLNMLFDPLWYFAFSYRLTRQKQTDPSKSSSVPN